MTERMRQIIACDAADIAWLTMHRDHVTFDTFWDRLAPGLSKGAAELRWHRMRRRFRDVCIPVEVVELETKGSRHQVGIRVCLSCVEIADLMAV